VLGRLDTGENGRTMLSGRIEVRVDIVDENKQTVDEVGTALVPRTGATTSGALALEVSGLPSVRASTASNTLQALR